MAKYTVKVYRQVLKSGKSLSNVVGASSGWTHFRPDWLSKAMVPGIAVALPLGRSSAGIRWSKSLTSNLPATRLVRVDCSTHGRCDCRKGRGLLPLSPGPALAIGLGCKFEERAAVRASSQSLIVVMCDMVSSMLDLVSSTT